MSQFYQLDRLVVEGGKTVGALSKRRLQRLISYQQGRQVGSEGDIIRETADSR